MMTAASPAASWQWRLSRQSWVWLHRWAGLFMAGFLIIAGVTGSALAFHDELDGWLNPDLMFIDESAGARPLHPLVLRDRAQAAFPQARFSYPTFEREPGYSYAVYAEPRTDPTSGKPYDLGFLWVYMHPLTGEVIGTREAPELGLDRRNLMPTIYRLHYTLLIPDPWGNWLFGVVALIWTFDCFVGVYLTLPRQRRGFLKQWRPAWFVKWRASLLRINFDLHRAASLWTWAFLFILAVSSVRLNLYDEVWRPTVLEALSVSEPHKALPDDPAPDPPMRWADALRRGEALMAREAGQANIVLGAPSGLYYISGAAAFEYTAHSSKGISGTFAETAVVFSARDGRLLYFHHPYMAPGNAVDRWVVSLHMGQVWGLPYQVFLSIIGAVLALVAGTGVYIWWRKRRARLAAIGRRGSGHGKKPVANPGSDTVKGRRQMARSTRSQA